MGHLSVCVCVSQCASGLTHTAPRPTSHVDGDGVAVRTHQRPANSEQQTAHNRWHALGEDETRRDTQDINHHHHHHPSSFHCDSEKCHFAASSLALPILRAPLVADASHAHYRYHSLGTSIQHKSSSPSLGTHPSPTPGRLTVYEPCRLPSLVPLSSSFSPLRALSTRYRCTYVSHPV